MQLLVGPWLAVGLALSYLVPNHYAPWLSFHHEVLAFVAFAPLCLVAVWRGAGGRFGAVVLATLSALPLASWWAGLTPFFGEAIVSAFFVAAAGWTFLAGRMDAGEPVAKGPIRDAAPASSIADHMFTALLLASIVSVGLILHQWLGLERSGLFIADMPKAARPFGNLAQPNHQSLLLALGIVAVWRLWEGNRVGSLAALLCVGWLLVGVVLTDSRAFYLGAVSFLIVILMVRRQVALRLSFSALGLVTIAYVGLSHGVDGIHKALLLTDPGTYGGVRMESVHSRAVIWNVLMHALVDRPVFGYGWGMVAYAQLEHANLAPGIRELFFNAHNWVLDLLIQVGVPITLAVVVALVWWFARSIRRCTSTAATAILLVPVLMLAYSFVEFQYTYAYFLLPAAYCGGLIFGCRTQRPQPGCDGPSSATSKAIAGLVFGATCLVGVWITIDYARFEGVWQRERFVLARIDPDGPRPDFHPIVLTNLQALLDLERAQSRQALDKLSLEEVAATASRYPYIPFVIKWADVLRGSGDTEQAQRRIDQVCAREGVETCMKIRRAVALRLESLEK